MMVTSREQKALAEGILVGRIRNLQDLHSTAHRALTNWGHWSVDRSDIYPRLKPPSLWDQFKRDENDPYGDEQAPAVSVEQQPAKAEAAEKQPYDERQALLVDARIHGYGGLPVEVRYTLKAAYVSREIPESQFPRAAGCGEDAFCERLENALLFVSRYI